MEGSWGPHAGPCPQGSPGLHAGPEWLDPAGWRLDRSWDQSCWNHWSHSSSSWWRVVGKEMVYVRCVCLELVLFHHIAMCNVQEVSGCITMV